MPFKNKQPKNVETITATLHATVAELEGHAENQLAHAARKAAIANAATAARDAHHVEHEKAKAVAANIKALLDA